MTPEDNPAGGAPALQLGFARWRSPSGARRSGGRAARACHALCRVCPGGTSEISPAAAGLRQQEDKPRQGVTFHRPYRGSSHFPCRSDGWHHRLLDNPCHLISVMPPASESHSMSGLLENGRQATRLPYNWPKPLGKERTKLEARKCRPGVQDGA